MLLSLESSSGLFQISACVCARLLFELFSLSRRACAQAERRAGAAPLQHHGELRRGRGGQRGARCGMRDVECGAERGAERGAGREVVGAGESWLSDCTEACNMLMAVGDA